MSTLDQKSIASWSNFYRTLFKFKELCKAILFDKLFFTMTEQ